MPKTFFRASLFLSCLQLHATLGAGVNLTGALVNQPSEVYASINASGTALVVWDYFDGTNYSILSSLYQGGSWATIDVVAPTTTVESYSSNAPLNASGKACIAWQQAGDSLYASLFNGSTWGSPELISGMQSLSLGVQTTVAYNDLNQAIVIWEGSDGHIYANVNNDGAGWLSTPTDVSTIGNTGSPVVALSNNQMAVAVWINNGSSPNQAYYATYSFQTTTWSSPAAISGSSYDQDSPQVFINATGVAAAVWEQNTMAGRLQIAASVYDGSWGAATILSDGMSGQEMYAPRVSVDASGDVFAVWQLGDEGLPMTGITPIQAAVYSSGSWGSAIDITPSMNSANTPTVAAAGSGLAVAAWNQVYVVDTHSSMHSVHASTYASSSWLDSDATLTLSGETSPDSANGNFTPSGIGINASGQAVVAWFFFDGTSYYVQASTDTSSVSPPANASGRQKNNQLPFQTQYFNSIQWTASPSSGVVGYQITRNGTPIATVSGLQYNDKSISVGQTYTYGIAAINGSGDQSTVTSLTIGP